MSALSLLQKTIVAQVIIFHEKQLFFIIYSRNYTATSNIVLTWELYL